ncbi:hypothetical protein N7G274_000603 [Stereocaulon virgatum]|uniref:Uncharacterized protein n=1 Tax=Stereocaulon virgatum TaxID=373712 RepID=A0ABR4AVD1_9LECA
MSSTTSAVGPELMIACDANIYGMNLKVASCKDIFRTLQKGDDEVIFADRKTTLPFDAPLPYRVQSPDGVCFIQVVLPPPKTQGRVSATQIGRAGFTIFDTCVKHYGYGGIAANIGGDNNLEVAIASYKPNVKCARNTFTRPLWRSCVDLFTLMRADRDIISFGQRKVEGVDVQLPFVIKSPDNRCQVKVDSTTPAPIFATFYELWEAVNSIAYMCVSRNEKGGKASKIGSASTMFLELSDENPDLAQIPVVPLALAANASAVEADLLSVGDAGQEFAVEEAAVSVEGARGSVHGSKSSQLLTMPQDFSKVTTA